MVKTKTSAPAICGKSSSSMPKKKSAIATPSTMKKSVKAVISKKSVTSANSPAPKAKPKNRGTYEEIGPADGKSTNVRGPAANRGTYEEIGPAAESSKPVAGGPVTNRPIYETVKAGVEADLPELEDPNKFTDGANEPDREPSRRRSRRRSRSPDSVSSGRVSRQKDRLEKQNKKLRMALMIGVGALALIVVAGGISMLCIYAVHPTKNSATTTASSADEVVKVVSSAKHFREDADKCPKPKDKESCVIGSPPMIPGHGHGCKHGKCSQMNYDIVRDASNGQLEVKEALIGGGDHHTIENIFCLASEGDRPFNAHVCVEKCNEKYNGTKGLFNMENYRGAWFDSCDTPNECWSSPWNTAVNTTGVIDRQTCLSDNHAKCPTDNVTAAIVWLQHLTCHINSAQSGDLCEGLPIQLWVCFKCSLSGDPEDGAKTFAKTACGDNATSTQPSLNKCVVECKYDEAESTYIFMPDGAACGEHNRYCFRGMCLSAKDKDHTVLSKEECKSLEALRKQFWNKYERS